MSEKIVSNPYKTEVDTVLLNKQLQLCGQMRTLLILRLFNGGFN
jgi:hypothetical protein